jgi:hypothetical protein
MRCGAVTPIGVIPSGRGRRPLPRVRRCGRRARPPPSRWPARPRPPHRPGGPRHRGRPVGQGDRHRAGVCAQDRAHRRDAVIPAPGRRTGPEPVAVASMGGGPGNLHRLCTAILEGTGRLSGPLTQWIARLATARRRAGRRSRLCWPIPVPSPRMRPESRRPPNIRVEAAGGLPERQRVRSQPGPQLQPA